jgi:hypothetical protein
MAIDVETLTIDQLEALIDNHRRKGAMTAPLYLEALSELEKRKGKGLEFAKSLSIILTAAKDGGFLSYKELADASGVDWGKPTTRSESISGGWSNTATSSMASCSALSL